MEHEWPLNHLGSIWYHSEPSDVPYSENLLRPISWFGLFLHQNDSRSCQHLNFGLSWHGKGQSVKAKHCWSLKFSLLCTDTALSQSSIISFSNINNIEIKMCHNLIVPENIVKTHHCAPVAHPTSNSNLTSSMSFANGLSNLWASDPNRSCGRCRSELGRIMNRGAFCRACNVKVCKSCREYGLSRGNSGTSDWLCTICYKGR